MNEKKKKHGGSDALYEDFNPHSKRKQKKKGGFRGLVITALTLLVVLGVGVGYLFFNNPEIASFADLSQFKGDDVVVEEDGVKITKDEIIEIDNSDLSVYPGLGEGVKNILLLGTDSRLSSQNGLTDSIIILSVNQDTLEVKLASIMRDTWVEIPGRSKNAKINAANVYGGPNLAIKTINECFDMNIDDYVLVNMQGLVGVLEVIGGIELDITQSEMKYINQNLTGYRGDLIAAGAKYSESAFAKLTTYGEKTHLTPQQALAYSRIRMLDSDYVRSERQRNVLVAMAQKVSQQNIIQLSSIATKVLPYLSTSLSVDEMLSLASVAWRTDMSTVEQMRLPVDGTFKSGKQGGVWSIRPDFAENSKLLHDFVYDLG